VKKAQIVGVLKPGSHYATQRPQDFYANYAANEHYMSSSMQNENSAAPATMAGSLNWRAWTAAGSNS